MKNLTTALKNHYAQELTTIATCWLVIRKDGQVFGFTEAASDLVIGAVTYHAATGLTPTTVQTSSQLNVDNLEITGMLSGDAIQEVDILAGVWDYARVSVFEVNYRDVSMGINPIRDGYLGQVNTVRNQFRAELRGLLQALQQPGGQSFGITCNADFCDTKCKLVESAWTSTGMISSITNGRSYVCSIANPGFNYTNGKITMTSGPATGFVIDVRLFTAPSSVVLQEMPPFAPNIGDSFTIVAGCDKMKTTCANTYGNIINFRGFPDVPGQDAIVSGK